jgi:hypothetical protein
VAHECQDGRSRDKCKIGKEPHRKSAPFHIAANRPDYGSHHEALNDDRAESAGYSDEKGIEQRWLV